MPQTLLSPPSATATASRTRPPRPSPRDRLLLAGLLGATAVLYLWDLGASGWANSFYAAAAQAGAESWHAFLFAASDAPGSITVDKTPMSVWAMALSVRLFGLSSWSLLVPQALMGVAGVGILATSVRRATGSPGAGLLAGTVLALTPVATLMFRFDNPDALLVLLLVGAAAATGRAVEATTRHPGRWLALAGVLVGLGFLTKMLQAFLVLPPLALVYLVAARPSLPRRFLHLAGAGAATVAAGGWWVALVELWPATSRPWIGGSQHDSVLELALGYNGLGRLTGDEVGSVGGGGGWGRTGLGRMFGGEIGGQIAWLLPAAMLLGLVALWLLRRAPRTDPVRAAILLWGGWLLVTAGTFSLMAGIFHAYYTVALAPAIGALVAIGAHLLWTRRTAPSMALLLAGTVAGTAGFSFALLGRTPDFVPWLRWVVLLAGATAALALAAGALLDRRALRPPVAAVIAGVALVTALVAALLGPAAYAVDTAATPHTGSIPSAGPRVVAAGPGGFGRPGGGPGGPGGPGGVPGARPGGPRTGAAGGPGGGGGAGGAAGGLLDAATPGQELTTLLATDAESWTWAAAAVGANTAAGYQLASGAPVMPIGGFNGSDPSPTLAQFQQYVADGAVHYFIAGGGRAGGGGGPAGGGPQPGGGTSSQIADWVAANFTATTVDGVSVYDLSGGVR